MKGNHPIKRKASASGRKRDRLLVTFYCERSKHKVRSRSVHVLVLEAFCGPRPEGLVACHWNGDSMDNRIQNLRWDTPEANRDDDVRNGVSGHFKNGVSHHNARLTEQVVRDVYTCWQGGETVGSIAKRLGLRLSTLRSIVYGYTWTHVTGLQRKATKKRNATVRTDSQKNTAERAAGVRE